MRLETSYPGLCDELTPAGHAQWRVRVEGDTSRNLTLKVTPKRPDFLSHYEAARAGQVLQAGPSARTKVGTLDALCEAYGAWMVVQQTAETFRL